MIGTIIQARLNSTRLPKKVIEKIEGKTVLEHVVQRMKKANGSGKIILATTTNKEDDVLEDLAKKLNISIFRGSEDDVLDRYYQAAKLFKIDPIIRITADCPLLDPEITEKVIELYYKGNYDYFSNAGPVTFPDGMDVEILSFRAIEKSAKEATLKSDREHVIEYMLRDPKTFKIGNFANNEDLSSLRLTLDEKEDLILIKNIFKELYKENQFFGLKDILKLFKNKPELLKINQHINRNEGLLKSLKNNKIYGK